MKNAVIMLFIVVMYMLAASAQIDDPTPISHDYEWLTYDDGTPNWVSWIGTYKGVWFNIQDFIPGSYSWEVGTAELWFYHHSEFPWDTSDVMVEIWNGDANGPTEQLGQQNATALHYAPIFIVFNPVLETGQNFWCITNTEASTGGWPSTLTDDSQGVNSHSFFSDDLIIWEPWKVQGWSCNYFIRLNDQPLGTGLSRTTWGSLKTTFY